MEKTRGIKRNFGLIGRNIHYSFSRGYFREKFRRLGLQGHDYSNYDLADIAEFPALTRENPDLSGLNVTIPYKEAVIPYLEALDPVATAIGAVNTIKFTPEGLIGFNTDAYGFQQALLPLLKPNHIQALILGTGGASKAVAYVLRKQEISYCYVSRKPQGDQLAYQDLTPSIMKEYTLLINCTPLGTWPDVDAKPAVPYDLMSPKHLLFDLIYNPEKTAFLSEGEKRGTVISNGLKMLESQAEKAWEIWNS
ncbi:MAG: shikimate dehydrogenase [Eudoraea sp.]|nr:shikimate dehydrogenase [Eudoraea sp.]NNJ39576.1 shikimate dehydrogenase [Eudoraea sp.]